MNCTSLATSSVVQQDSLLLFFSVFALDVLFLSTATTMDVMILVCGVIIQDMKWKTHIQGSEQSLVKQLTSRINGLVKVSINASKETRLMVANGIFMSKLCYLIQVWGSCEKYLIKILQVLQNKAARLVTGKSWFSSTRRLLKDCNWLSVQQLVFFHTALQIHKIMLSGTHTSVK